MRRLNWEAPQSLDDLNFIQDVYTEEFLERIKLVFGSSYSSTWWGIVDETKPASAQISETRPLIVRASSAQPLKIEVLSGIVVTSTGERVVLTSAQGPRDLADTGSGAINVVYLRSFEESDKSIVNDYSILVPSRYNTPDDEDILQVATLSDWLAFSSTEKEEFVALAVVTVQPISTGGLELSVDMTQNSYTWNRPWFSPVDIGHRTQIGTGTTTENNPHGLQVNDMVAGGHTLWQLLLDYGIIVAEDVSYAKIPGVECEQIVLVGSIQIDTTGAITGTVGSPYVTLLYYPSSIVRITDNTTGLEEIAGTVLPGTRIIYFDPTEKFSDGNPVSSKDLKVFYTWVQTGHPIINTPQSNLEISNPISRQALIAGGLQITDLSDETLDFADAGGIPKRYKTFVDESKTVRKRPQVIFCTKKLDEVGTSIEPFVISPYGPGKIRVGLTGATSGPVPGTLEVKLNITGKDEDGNVIAENVTFDQFWVENLPGATSEEPFQFKLTTNTFAEITQWDVTNRTDDGPNSAVMMWIEQDPVTSEVMADVLPLFDCFWDGTQILDMVDTRPINTIAKNPTKSPLLASVEVQKDSNGDIILVSETRTKNIDPSKYIVDIPALGGADWELTYKGNLIQLQSVMTRADALNPSTYSLRVPLDSVLPSTCSLIQAVVPFWLYGSGAGTAFFNTTPYAQDLTTGIRTSMPLGSDVSNLSPSSPPPEFSNWIFPNYHMVMNAAPTSVNQQNNSYYLEIEYFYAAPFAIISSLPYLAATSVTYQETVMSSTGSIWNIGTYLAEDFRSPLWMDGTQSTLSKDTDGLGIRDTYVSRPIPVPGSGDTEQRLRFIIFGAEDEANLTFQYRYADSATGVWSTPWTTPVSPVGPHTVDITASINKIQVRLNPDGNVESSALGIGVIHWSHS